jgi:hypothetical protein
MYRREHGYRPISGLSVKGRAGVSLVIELAADPGESGFVAAFDVLLAGADQAWQEEKSNRPSTDWGVQMAYREGWFPGSAMRPMRPELAAVA